MSTNRETFLTKYINKMLYIVSESRVFAQLTLSQSFHKSKNNLYIHFM